MNLNRPSVHLLQQDYLEDKVKKWRQLNARTYGEKRRFGFVES